MDRRLQGQTRDRGRCVPPTASPYSSFSIAWLPFLSVCLLLVHAVIQNELAYSSQSTQQSRLHNSSKDQQRALRSLMEIFLLMAYTAPTHILPLKPLRYPPINGETKARHTAAKWQCWDLTTGSEAHYPRALTYPFPRRKISPKIHKPPISTQKDVHD